jgi:diaminopimelate epimerase
MLIPFCKYHGAGNDFVLIDNRSKAFSTLSETAVAWLCNRRLGIGADGLMLLESPAGNEDFGMRYFNSDGRESSMCGNGGRCLTAFAHRLLTAKNTCSFRAIDGMHTAEITAQQGNECTVRLQMIAVETVEKRGNDYLLNTGSPHLVRFTDHINTLDFCPEARAIRYNKAVTGNDGANINFVRQTPQQLLLRTYERGVEDETPACGTGAVAAAIAAQLRQGQPTEGQPCGTQVQARGGLLRVDFTYRHGAFTDVFLTGPAAFVFEGTVSL